MSAMWKRVPSGELRMSCGMPLVTVHSSVSPGSQTLPAAVRGPAASLKRVAGICEHWEYEDDEEVVTQDSVSRLLYVLLEGTVDVKVRGAEKEPVTVSAIQKGDVFGEAGLFMDVRRTASTARVCSRVSSVPAPQP